MRPTEYQNNIDSRIKRLSLQSLVVEPAFDDILKGLVDDCGCTASFLIFNYQQNAILQGYAGAVLPQSAESRIQLPSLCAQAMEQNDRVFEISKVQKDHFFYRDNDFLRSTDVGAFAACSILSKDNAVIGTLCATSSSPSVLSTAGKTSLIRAGRIIEHIIGYRDAALTDELTEVSNRRFLEKKLRSDWDTAKREDSTVGVMMIDIDHFKQVNDTLGHHVGDLCLQRVAQKISSMLPGDNEVLGRYGGEDFVAILPKISAKQLEARAQAIRHAVANTALPKTDGKRVTVSIGLASLSPSSPVTYSPELALKHADSALYKAKTSGRNAVVMHSESMKSSAAKPFYVFGQARPLPPPD